MSKLLDFINENGRSPQVTLQITPLDTTRPRFILSQFLSYSFSSSVLIPVDAFQFKFTMPEVQGSIDDYVQEGDIAELIAGAQTVCTGIVDVVDIETTLDGGDVVTIIGRNLLGQIEDQSTVNTLDKPMWGNAVSLAQAAGSVIQNTRIRGLINQNAPAGTFLFATEPGETKLSALNRFVEPLNCLVWGDPDGFMVVGRPNMGADPIGEFYCDKDNRNANVMSIKAIRASTQIPNIVLPVWSGQETVQSRVSAQQALLNPADGPKRLRLNQHNVQRCVVVSTPSGSDPQSLSDINAIKVGGANLLQAYALREMARANIQELTVQVNVKSHFTDSLDAILIDQVYSVDYTRAGIQEKMYAYQVEYTCDNTSGPRTSVYLCKLGRIVAGVSVGAVQKALIASGKLPTL